MAACIAALKILLSISAFALLVRITDVSTSSRFMGDKQGKAKLLLLK